ncbi:MAG TPA: hypothetical protein VN682_20275 [Terriglobales bacterium]|nr:hypothetical protein [Terriglobales bacterium]
MTAAGTSDLAAVFSARSHVYLVPRSPQEMDRNSDNVYGKPLDEVKIPAGYKRLPNGWFDIPRPHEFYVTEQGRVAVHFSNGMELGKDKRRILVYPEP